MKLEEAQAAFQSILDGLDKSADSVEFLQWIRDSFTTEKCDETTEADIILLQIVNDLKAMVPAQGIVADEKIVWPREGMDSDCDPKTTIHVDGFLYGSDADVDDLCDSAFISHSTSIPQVKFIFGELLPNLSGKTVLDIGSRLGPLLYAAYQYSDCKKIIGIEISEQLCQIQTAIVQKYSMQDRIEIIHGDIRDHIELFNTADVIFMNNTFQFFMLTADQIEIWQKLYENSRTGQIFITIPSVQEFTDHLALPFNVASWANEIPTEHLLLKHSNNLEIFNELQQIHMQEIKK